MFQKFRRKDSGVRLDRLQRMQIRIRRLKKPRMVVILGTVIVLFLLLFLTSFPKPDTVETLAAVDATDAADVADATDVTMDFVGDVMMGRYIKKYGEKKEYRNIFAGISPMWNQSDFVFANLDSAVLKDDPSEYEEQDKSNPLYCEYPAVAAARNAGINVFGCANNHSYDYGEKAVTELLDYFRVNDVFYAGIGNTNSDAASYTLLEKGNMKVAFIALTDVYSIEAMAEEDKAGVLTTLYLDYNLMVSRASREADVTIVYCYWGKEDEISSNQKQSSLGHQLIDAGADIVVGMHPHVIQDVELYKEGIIFYSLGSFVFDQGDSYSRDSVVVRYRTNENGFGSFELTPIRIEDGIPAVTGNDFYRNRIFHELTQNLEESDYYYNKDGNVVIPFVMAKDLEISVQNVEMAEPAGMTETTEPAGE